MEDVLRPLRVKGILPDALENKILLSFRFSGIEQVALCLDQILSRNILAHGAASLPSLPMILRDG